MYHTNDQSVAWTAPVMVIVSEMVGPLICQIPPPMRSSGAAYRSGYRCPSGLLGAT